MYTHVTIIIRDYKFVKEIREKLEGQAEMEESKVLTYGISKDYFSFLA